MAVLVDANGGDTHPTRDKKENFGYFFIWCLGFDFKCRGFTNEDGEKLQRCMKSVEAISAEIKPGIKQQFFEQQSITELQKLASMEADRLGRLSLPMILRAGKSHYERISWSEIYQIAEAGFRKTPAARYKIHP